METKVDSLQKHKKQRRLIFYLLTKIYNLKRKETQLHVSGVPLSTSIDYNFFSYLHWRERRILMFVASQEEQEEGDAAVN